MQPEKMNLSENQNRILKILSYSAIPLAPGELALITGRQKQTSEFAKDCNSLLEKGFLALNNAKYVICPAIALRTLKGALRDGDFSLLIPEILKFEGSFYRMNFSYRLLRNLFVKRYLNNETEFDYNTLYDIRCYASDYFEYLDAVADNEEFLWLLHALGENALYSMLNKKMVDIREGLQRTDKIFLFDNRLKNIPGLVTDENLRRMMRVDSLMLNGQFRQMEELTAQMHKHSRSLIALPSGIYDLYKGDAEKAFRQIHPVMTSKKKTEMFVNYEIFYAVYYMLSLLGMDAEQYTPEAKKMLEKKVKHYDNPVLLASAMMYYVMDEKDKSDEIMKQAVMYARTSECLNMFFLYIAACFTETKLDISYLHSGKALLDKAAENGYKLLALELAFALSKVYQNSELESRYTALSKELNQVSVLSRRQSLESWEQRLKSLMGAMSMTAAQSKPKGTRIVYFIDPDKLHVQPAEQTATANGAWSKGRNIALQRFKERDVEGMTEQDHRIAGTIVEYYRWRDSGLKFSQAVWPALAGHPYLFMNDSRNIPVELIKAQPAVTVEENDKGLMLKADIDPSDANCIIQKETSSRYKLIHIDSSQHAILRIINKETMVIPRSGKEKLMRALDGLSGFFTIHSDLEETRKETRAVEGDPRIHVQLLPLGDSLKAEIFVKPFGTVPPYCKPGVGGRNIIGMVGDERCHAIRDLKTEARYAETILEEIQQNTAIDVSQGAMVFEEPGDCLSLLEVLSSHQDIAVVEWPEGVRFNIKRSVSLKNLNLEVKGIDFWFELDGNLRIDENQVISLQKLLELNSSSRNRFIELGGGEFLALSADLKKRLDELQAYTDKAGKQTKLSRFASMPLMDLFGQAGSFKGDKKWKDFMKQMEAANAIEPAIPNTLQADLRPYQEEGFRWMARLSEWGAGACLADDMGLGKTVQALAMLLHRAGMGAALVVCPASVVPNWVQETSRFAPNLNVMPLRAYNRRETIEKSGAFDLVITTYGLLQSEEELFANNKWATVILDEAHAIKNYNTMTSKAAMSLDAGFRLVMTGTPVQNHLGEVWSLFNFVNPGLLGTMQQFNDRFIKVGTDGQRRLKKLVAPFILRRTKNSVLEDLPPKTEIVKQVELSEEERSFYEALRRQAVENLQNAVGPAGQQHVKALAEITRLRLACCNPSLVEPDLRISSSKLSAFMDIVDELRGGKHRALVFSQFVKHLSVVRQELDEKKISYKYIDGSSSMNERARNVSDFQSGDGELFLISLKAGGLGINLTAADYVIHLDPWWNPAIEDQASDRTHRIGQTRPITIYRLVAQDTIEEKIIRLHHSKRDIADSLLEDAAAPGKLSTEELLKLIME